MPSSLKRYDHSKVKNALQNYIKSNDVIVNTLFPNENIDNKALMKNIYYEVFYTDVLSKPDIEQEYVVFFAKATTGEVHTISVKLSNIV